MALRTHLLNVLRCLVARDQLVKQKLELSCIFKCDQIHNRHSTEFGHTVVKNTTHSREYQRGKYHCTVDLLFDWFGLVCLANKNKNYQ